MALGDANQKSKDKSYYSRLGFRDYSHDSKKRINISYWAGMIKITIERDKGNGFEYEEIVSSFIPPSKAKIFYNELVIFNDLLKNGKLKNPKEGYGIHTGMNDNQRVTCVHITENGLPALFIAKVDPQGKFLEHDDYEFNNNDFMFALKLPDIEDVSKFESKPYENFELQQLTDLMYNFSNNMDGAIAYSVVDIARYEWDRMINKINAIGEKNGLDFGENRGGFQSRSYNGIFSNNSRANNASSNHTDIDSISSKYSLDDED